VVVFVVGVHGIGQEQVGRRQLVDRWGPAFADGLDLAAGGAGHAVDLDVAFYGNVFPARMKPHQSLKGDPVPGDAFEAVLEGLDEEEAAELAAGLAEGFGAVPPDGDVSSKGYTRMPLVLQTVVRGVERQFGFTAAVLCLGTLRQVRRYLREPVLKAEVDRRVSELVGDGCRVLIGHSLGSVVAYEHLRQRTEAGPVLLVTLGSPLGLRMIRQWLPATGPSDGLPGGVAGWVNVFDRRDPVACVHDLERWWPGVVGVAVDNGGDAHQDTRYLSKRETGAAVLAALHQAGVDVPRH
jgi:hypothetical protein